MSTNNEFIINIKSITRYFIKRGNYLKVMQYYYYLLIYIGYSDVMLLFLVISKYL